MILRNIVFKDIFVYVCKKLTKINMNCKNCNKEKRIQNKFFELCLECNNMRLEELKPKSNISTPKKKDKPLKRIKKKKQDNSYFVKNFVSKKSTKEKILEDEVFYEECFNNSDHKCEECGCELPDQFRNDEGKLIARWRYSHIIPKSIAKYLRHVVLNINHLCLKHHQQWETGDKKNMRIYNGNVKRFPNHF